MLTGAVDPTRPLIVVALPEEAAHLPADLPVLLTGVGKVRAATAVARLLATGPHPSEVINVGTAGALRPGLTGTHEVARVLEHDFDRRAIEVLTGRTFGAPLELARPGVVLATGDVFVSDPAVRDALAAQAHLVDMEGYAIAAAGHEFGVGVRIVKHVSDGADGEATASWHATVDACARALAQWLHANR